MQTKERIGDLRSLSRETGDFPNPTPAIPPPRFAWKTRVLLPGAILLALTLLLGYTAQDVLFPPRGVKVVPVLLKSIATAQDAATQPAAITDAPAINAPGAAAALTDAPAIARATGAPGSTAAAPAPNGAATVQAPGWVEPDPYPIAATALAGGVVKEVLALEGQSVKAGDVVARLIDDDARLALARAEAELAAKSATLEAAQRQWDNPIERTRALAAAEAMVAQTNAHIEKHHAEVAVEQARLEQAQEEFDRVQASMKSRAVSEIEFVRAKQTLAAQKATLKATEAELAIFNADLAQRTAELTAANENLRLRIEESQALAEAKAAVAMATAAREEAALRLERMQVRAPADGIVMQRLVETGSKLLLDMDDPRSAQAVRLYDPQKLQVRVDVPLADAARVGVGMDAQVVVGVLPDRTFRGTVTRIVNEADIQKNTLQVKVAITDPSAALKPEMLARVRFTGAVPNPNGAPAPAANSVGAAPGGQTLFAPLALLHRPDEGENATVWVFEPRRGIAMHKAIVLDAYQQDGWIAVRAGLAPGDQLIVAGHDDLSDGQRVRVIGEADPSELSSGEGSNHGAD